jgi:hypothetical protein
MSTLKEHMHTHLRPNPKLPPNVDWTEITSRSAIDDRGNPPYVPMSKKAFTGFVPVYAEDGPKVGAGYRGLAGRRRSVLWAGDEIIKSFFEDNVELLNNSILDAKRHGVRLDVKAERGITAQGPPYAMGITGIWTVDQLKVTRERRMATQKNTNQRPPAIVPRIDQDSTTLQLLPLALIRHCCTLLQIERQHLKSETRKYTNEITRFHTPGEWEKIDSILDDIGDYAGIDRVSGTIEAVRAR